MVPCAFYFCWANGRKMPLGVQVDRRKQLLKIPFCRGFFQAAGGMSGRLCAGTRVMLEADQSVGENAVGLHSAHSASRVCPRWWEGVR